uniref:Eukaryotic translation initiation factor 5B n=1 Tax=Steinernema glaseri TaxID=37863 RepID=A0A1I7YD20_9BILA
MPPKKKKAGPGGGNKAMIAALKEAMRAQEEAEEKARLEREEEERRLEQLRLEEEAKERELKEKKEREKQKKKEREARLKAEGKWLTPAQRQKLARQREALGIDVAEIAARVDAEAPEEEGKKKRVLYGKKKSKKDKEEATESSQSSVQPSREVSVEPTKAEESPKPQEKEPVVESAAPEEEDVLDDWELADEEPATAQASADAAKETEKQADKKTEESNEDEEDEDEDEEEDEEDEEESESEEERAGGTESKEQIRERVRARMLKRAEDAEKRRSTDKLRAPVICVLGHVDTGKTKMLDTIRRTNVQDGEAGGITQQIGATQVPGAAIKERCKNVRDFHPDNMRIPGFLIIDTPGHESFSNLRSRGSSLCDFAILVVDLMHGLEPQTIESIKLLLKRKTPFIIALNKIDRLYGYESNPRKDIWQHLKSQPHNTQMEFKERYDNLVAQFAAEVGLNVVLANKNTDPKEYYSMIPTSAFHGDGIGNLMSHIVDQCQTRLAERIAYSEELQCTVMEVKSIPGLGTTIDVILVNGALEVGKPIILSGFDGAIATTIRDLLMPQPLRELRVKAEYEHFKRIEAAQGVKILAKDLEKAVAGLPLYVAHQVDEVDILIEDAAHQFEKSLTSIKKKPEGVYVQASTLGSLEALLEFLRTEKIPYSNVNIGPVHKKDVQRAAAMREHKEEYACILAFDVPVVKEAQNFADKEGVRIFQADIIYHLEDSFLKYKEELRLKRRRENEHLAIFPCRLRIMPQHIFNARNPIVCGVSVESGQLKRGTPICVPSKDKIFIGTVSSIERNHEQVELAKAGDEICIKIENTTGEAPKLYGRHFTHEDLLVSRISRESIDVCKTHFRDDLSREDWQLVVNLKKVLDIL